MAERFLRTIRLLAECYQAFERMSGRHIRELGLTAPQFDIIATLGRTGGMSCGELGDRTLITKGTLTGVLDRLEARGLLLREPSRSDRRSVNVRLTPEGETLFEQVFPQHVSFMKSRLSGWTEADLANVDAQLTRLRDALAASTPSVPEQHP